MTTTPDNELKAGVSVTQMAQMVGLSLRRFYQLMGAGVFPMPSYLLVNRRPVFTPEQQQECVEVKRRQCGINGEVVFFHSPRSHSSSGTKSNRPKTTATNPIRHRTIIDALSALGMTGVTDRQIEQAMTTVYPAGKGQTPDHDVIRALFLHLRSVKKSADNVGG